MREDIIELLLTTDIGIEHDDILCPTCNNFSKPIGLGNKFENKIQLIRVCYRCYCRFWYWIGYEGCLTPFSDT